MTNIERNQNSQEFNISYPNEEASCIFIASASCSNISREIRAQWIFQNMKKYVIRDTISDILTVAENRIRIISVLPSNHTNSDRHLLLSPSTRIVYIERCHNFLICIDVSSYLVNSNIHQPSSFFNMIYEIIYNILESLTHPLIIPNNEIKLSSIIHVKILAVSKYQFPQEQVLVQSQLLNSDSLRQIAMELKTNLDAVQEWLMKDTQDHLIIGDFTYMLKRCLSEFFYFVAKPLHTIIIISDNSYKNLPDENFFATIRISRQNFVRLFVIPFKSNKNKNSTVFNDNWSSGNKYQFPDIPSHKKIKILCKRTHGAILDYTIILNNENYTSNKLFTNYIHESLLIIDSSHCSLQLKNPFELNSIPNIPYLKNRNIWHLYSRKLQLRISLQIINKINEGFTIKQIEFTDNNDTLNVVLVQYRLNGITILYHIKSQWPIIEENPITYATLYFAVKVLPLSLNSNSISIFQHKSFEINEISLIMAEIINGESILCQLSFFSKTFKAHTVLQELSQSKPIFSRCSNTKIISLKLIKPMQYLDESFDIFYKFWKLFLLFNSNHMYRFFKSHTFEVALILNTNTKLKFLKNPIQFGNMGGQGTPGLIFRFFKEWSSFVLLENEIYIKYLYTERDRKPYSFCAVYIIIESLVMNIKIIYHGAVLRALSHKLSESIKSELIFFIQSKIKQNIIGTLKIEKAKYDIFSKSTSKSISPCESQITFFNFPNIQLIIEEVKARTIHAYYDIYTDSIVYFEKNTQNLIYSLSFFSIRCIWPFQNISNCCLTTSPEENISRIIKFYIKMRIIQNYTAVYSDFQTNIFIKELYVFNSKEDILINPLNRQKIIIIASLSNILPFCNSKDLPENILKQGHQNYMGSIYIQPFSGYVKYHSNENLGLNYNELIQIMKNEDYKMINLMLSYLRLTNCKKWPKISPKPSYSCTVNINDTQKYTSPHLCINDIYLPRCIYYKNLTINCASTTPLFNQSSNSIYIFPCSFDPFLLLSTCTSISVLLFCELTDLTLYKQDLNDYAGKLYSDFVKDQLYQSNWSSINFCQKLSKYFWKFLSDNFNSESKINLPIDSLSQFVTIFVNKTADSLVMVLIPKCDNDLNFVRNLLNIDPGANKNPIFIFDIDEPVISSRLHSCQKKKFFFYDLATIFINKTVDDSLYQNSVSITFERLLKNMKNHISDTTEKLTSMYAKLCIDVIYFCFNEQKLEEPNTQISKNLSRLLELFGETYKMLKLDFSYIISLSKYYYPSNIILPGIESESFLDENRNFYNSNLKNIIDTSFKLIPGSSHFYYYTSSQIINKTSEISLFLSLIYHFTVSVDNLKMKYSIPFERLLLCEEDILEDLKRNKIYLLKGSKITKVVLIFNLLGFFKENWSFDSDSISGGLEKAEMRLNDNFSLCQKAKNIHNLRLSNNQKDKIIKMFTSLEDFIENLLFNTMLDLSSKNPNLVTTSFLDRLSGFIVRKQNFVNSSKLLNYSDVTNLQNCYYKSTPLFFLINKKAAFDKFKTELVNQISSKIFDFTNVYKCGDYFYFTCNLTVCDTKKAISANSSHIFPTISIDSDDDFQKLKLLSQEFLKNKYSTSTPNLSNIVSIPLKRSHSIHSSVLKEYNQKRYKNCINFYHKSKENNQNCLKFWVIYHISNEKLEIFVHHKNCSFVDKFYINIQNHLNLLLKRLIQITFFTQKKINQKFLLQDLYETHICHPKLYLEKEKQEAGYERSFCFFIETLNFSNVDFSCKLLSEVNICYNYRMIKSPLENNDEHTKKYPYAIKVIEDLFQIISIANRSLMFVFKDEDTVFYFRIFTDSQWSFYHNDRLFPTCKALLNDEFSTFEIENDGKINSNYPNEKIDNNIIKPFFLLKFYGINAIKKKTISHIVDKINETLNEALFDFINLEISKTSIARLYDQDIEFLQCKECYPSWNFSVKIPKSLSNYTSNVLKFLIKFLRERCVTISVSSPYFKSLYKNSTNNIKDTWASINHSNSFILPCSSIELKQRGLITLVLVPLTYSARHNEFKAFHSIENKEFTNIDTSTNIDFLSKIKLDKENFKDSTPRLIFEIWKVGYVDKKFVKQFLLNILKASFVELFANIFVNNISTQLSEDILNYGINLGRRNNIENIIQLNPFYTRDENLLLKVIEDPQYARIRFFKTSITSMACLFDLSFELLRILHTSLPNFNFFTYSKYICKNDSSYYQIDMEKDQNFNSDLCQSILIIGFFDYKKLQIDSGIEIPYQEQNNSFVLLSLNTAELCLSMYSSRVSKLIDDRLIKAIDYIIAWVSTRYTLTKLVALQKMGLFHLAKKISKNMTFDIKKFLAVNKFKEFITILACVSPGFQESFKLICPYIDDIQIKNIMKYEIRLKEENEDNDNFAYPYFLLWDNHFDKTKVNKVETKDIIYKNSQKIIQTFLQFVNKEILKKEYLLIYEYFTKSSYDSPLDELLVCLINQASTYLGSYLIELPQESGSKSFHHINCDCLRICFKDFFNEECLENLKNIERKKVNIKKLFLRAYIKQLAFLGFNCFCRIKHSLGNKFHFNSSVANLNIVADTNIGEFIYFGKIQKNFLFILEFQPECDYGIDISIKVFNLHSAIQRNYKGILAPNTKFNIHFSKIMDIIKAEDFTLKFLSDLIFDQVEANLNSTPINFDILSVIKFIEKKYSIVHIPNFIILTKTININCSQELTSYLVMRILMIMLTYFSDSIVTLMACNCLFKNLENIINTIKHRSSPEEGLNCLLKHYIPLIVWRKNHNNNRCLKIFTVDDCYCDLKDNVEKFLAPCIKFKYIYIQKSIRKRNNSDSVQIRDHLNDDSKYNSKLNSPIIDFFKMSGPGKKVLFSTKCLIKNLHLIQSKSKLGKYPTIGTFFCFSTLENFLKTDDTSIVHVTMFFCQKYIIYWYWYKILTHIQKSFKKSLSGPDTSIIKGIDAKIIAWSNKHNLYNLFNIDNQIKNESTCFWSDIFKLRKSSIPILISKLDPLINQYLTIIAKSINFDILAESFITIFPERTHILGSSLPILYRTSSYIPPLIIFFSQSLNFLSEFFFQDSKLIAHILTPESDPSSVLNFPEFISLIEDIGKVLIIIVWENLFTDRIKKLK